MRVGPMGHDGNCSDTYLLRSALIGATLVPGFSASALQPQPPLPNASREQELPTHQRKAPRDAGAGLFRSLDHGLFTVTTVHR